ncbi:MAG: hypothetical protein AB7V46_22120 [Thermomicrobiales bacterium]
MSGILLAILFDFVTVGITDSSRFAAIQADHRKLMEFLAVPFDLWLIAFAAVVGAFAVVDPGKKGPLAAAGLGLAVSLLLILGSLVASGIFSSAWLSVAIPDLVGAGAVGFTAHQVLQVT